MKKFDVLEGIVVPLDRANVDTDAIIPKQFLKSIKRSGYGPYLFDEWRYADVGEPEMNCSGRPLKEQFVLNKPQYQGANILLTRENFGCGSSREHAPWALLDYGFRCVIAPSFADIFYNNCFKNGICPICLQPDEVSHLFDLETKKEGFTLRVELESQQVLLADGSTMNFSMDVFRKHCLLNGLDDISLTLQKERDIIAYEQRRKHETPWLFRDLL